MFFWGDVPYRNGEGGSAKSTGSITPTAVRELASGTLELLSGAIVFAGQGHRSAGAHFR